MSQRYLSDFQFLGIQLGNSPVKVIGSESGEKCVIVSGGRCVWDDLFALGVMGGDNSGWDVMCVNDIYMHYPGRVDHLYSNDHKMIPFWEGARRHQYRKMERDNKWPKTQTHSNTVGGQHTWPWPGNGTSSLGAVYTAIGLGYDKIVLCGVPLDDSGHYFEPSWVKSRFSREVPLKPNGRLAYWTEGRKTFKGRVFSMSGRTRELLGAP